MFIVCGMMRHIAPYCGILRHLAAKTTQRAAPQRNASGVNEPLGSGLGLVSVSPLCGIFSQILEFGYQHN